MAICEKHGELLPGCTYCRTGTEPETVAQYPLTCKWCRNTPADHVAVYDYRHGTGAPERITVMLCGPCGHSVTILPPSFERWWLFRLTSDGEDYATECDRNHALDPTP